MLAGFEDIGIEMLTAVVSPVRVSIAEQCKGLFTESQAKRLQRTTGITKLSKFPFSKNICASDLCVAAAERLLAVRGKRDDIGALVFVTQTPDVPMPSTAFFMQERLGISHEAIVFDVNLACSGFVEGLFLAASFAANDSFEKKKILLCCGDVRTPTHPEDVSLLPLRGEAGTAAIIGRKSSESPVLGGGCMSISKAMGIWLKHYGYHEAAGGRPFRQNRAYQQATRKIIRSWTEPG